MGVAKRMAGDEDWLPLIGEDETHELPIQEA
jgi:hypothetical protein